MASLSMIPVMICYPAAAAQMKSRKISSVILSKHGDQKAKAVITSSGSVDDHWDYCRKMLPKVSRSFAPFIHELPQPELRDAFCIIYLVLRNIDTIEDDMELPLEVKIPIARDFHRHLYDKDWKFICGTGSDRELTEGNHLINAAFMDLDTRCREIIMETARVAGEGTAIWLTKEIETMSDLEEYIGYGSSIVMAAMLKLAHVLIGEDLVEDSGAHAMAVLQHKNHVINSYHEDITQIPRAKMYWPAAVWRKYADKLEDFQDELNSVKATQLLNEMITDALSHVEDSLEVIAKIKDPSLLRFIAITRLAPMGELALCYNNPEIFRKRFGLKPGVKTRMFDGANTKANIYGAFYDVCCLMESKVNHKDPHASQTLSTLEAIKKKCMDSGTLPQRNFVIFESIQDIA